MRFNIQKKTFTKLYRYYCRKLRGSLFWLLIPLVILILNFAVYRSLAMNIEFNTKTEIFGTFILISFVQAFDLTGLIIFTTVAVSKLSGASGFWKRSQSTSEDALMVSFACPNNRQTIVAAKLSAVAIYYFTINFLLYTLPTLFLLLSFTNLSAVALFSFVLLNVGLSLVNFAWAVPTLFYFNIQKKMFLFFLYLLAVGIMSGLLYSFFPLFSPLLFGASFVVGGYFWLRYWKTFRKLDL